MIAAADGDRAAIDPLFRALWPSVVAYATRMLGDVALAEDCAQNAMTRMFGQLDDFDRAGDALTWTLTHVTWQCRTARTSRARRAEAPETLAPSGSLDGRALLEDRDLIRAALREVEQLDPRDAEVIAAALSGDDALRASMAPATFRKRLERALSRLRASWRARHGAR
jgi:DNA-directed RNA polymerase specialized sigma24 family protein